jgi:arginine-tRNA-protein transferase
MVGFQVPKALTKRRLDALLSQGWVRFGAVLFESDVAYLDGDVYPVVHIRADLRKHGFTPNQRKLLSRSRRRFRTEIGLPDIDARREALYAAQKPRFKGFMFDTLAEFVRPALGSAVFDTRELRVWDEDRLVAVSYFDLGVSSHSSLLALHDPEYADHSLGTYTLLEEIDAAKGAGFSRFYPGYVVRDHGCFDYKLRIGALSYLSATGRWKDIARLSREFFPIDLLRLRLSTHSAVLAQHDIRAQVVANPYFAMWQITSDRRLIASPVYLDCGPAEGSVRTLVVPQMDGLGVEVVLASPTHRYDHLVEGTYSKGYFGPLKTSAPMMRARLSLETTMDPDRVVHAVQLMAQWRGPELDPE